MTTKQTERSVEEKRKEFGLLFGAPLSYDQQLMESIFDWHLQAERQKREEMVENTTKMKAWAVVSWNGVSIVNDGQGQKRIYRTRELAKESQSRIQEGTKVVEILISYNYPTQ